MKQCLLCYQIISKIESWFVMSTFWFKCAENRASGAANHLASLLFALACRRLGLEGLPSSRVMNEEGGHS
jgi:hypothetical protein